YHILFFAGFAPETAPNPEQAKIFVDTWNQKGWTWDGIAEGSRGYDAILTLVEAIQLGGGGSREQIRAGLEKVDIMGLTAHIKFDATHDAQPNIILVEIKDGKSQIVSCD
ncbi:MAG: ABC transporter substrate-binding protein, partial [Chloroflexi bacterium]|nr:ABC transporter substrate-binding protein [Chloroflexota bacterium]